MNVFLRCDIGGHHGLGHAVRMRALAGALRTRGASVTFITTTPALASFVDPFSTHVMATEMLTDTIQRLTRWHLHKVLVIDHKYAYHPSRLMEIRRSMPVVRIDEPRATPATCDLLIAPNAHWDAALLTKHTQAFGARFLAGWDYALLPLEVTKEQRTGPRKGITFTAGGSDPTQARATMVEWTRGLDLETPLYFPAVGFADAYREGVRTAEMVVGFFGLTTYECLWYGTPQMVFSRSAEDILGAQVLQEHAPYHLCSAAFFDAYTPALFCALVRDVYHQYLADLSPVPTMMDGLGVSRVADAIMAL